MKKKSKFVQQAFTLIEVLVVIVIIGILVGVLLPNLAGMRGRARDTRVKSELAQLKTALQLYYSDFKRFPATDVASETGTEMFGCGDGDDRCPWGGKFSALVNGRERVYMEQLPNVLAPNGAIVYTQPNGDQSYLLQVTLESASDQSIEISQIRCRGEVDNPPSTNYYICS